MVGVNLRDKIVFLVRASHRQSLHRILTEQTFNAGLGDEPVGRTSKQEFLPGIREDTTSLHGEHLGERRERIGVESAEGLSDAHFHVDGHH